MSFRLKNAYWLIAICLPVIAILLRWECRSIFYPGWDLLGAANGLYLLSTSSLLEAIKESFWLSRNFQYWNQTNSVLFSLIPGSLSRLLPSEFWPHLLTLLVFGLSVYLIARITNIRKDELPVLALLLATSPALLSFSIAGYPYISGFLPHGLALLLVTRRNNLLHPVITLLLGIGIIELSWHVYELGKTVFIVFFSAALLLPSLSARNRLIYAALGIAAFARVLSYRQTNVDQLLQPEDGLSTLFNAIANALDLIFLQAGLDIPILAILGLLSLIFIRKQRWFFASCLIAQWILVIILSLRGMHELRPRRFLVVDMYSTVVILAALLPIIRNEVKNSYSRHILIISGLFLASGVVWQFYNLSLFCQLDTSDRNRALPYTDSSADYYINPPLIKAADNIASLASSDRHVILIYSYLAYAENTTDPASIPERIYLKLGHEQFSRHVHIFSDLAKRYSQVPVNPISTLEARIYTLKNSIQAKNVTPGSYIVARYTILHDERFKNESDHVWTMLDQHFILEPVDQDPCPDSRINEIPLFDLYSITGVRNKN